MVPPASHEQILGRLAALRATDAPTHGGHVLSYVYDSGLAELDELAAAAARDVQSVNGLDPTTFGSVAVLEREVLGFVRELLHGETTVVGSVTTGGTESCLLAVKTARDAWRAAGGQGVPRLLAPTTVHAAFHKAASYFGLALDLVPVDPATGTAAAVAIISRLGRDVALVVVSAPSYPFAALDPVAAVAEAAEAAGIACHVDACIGGLALPFEAGLPEWDFRVPGVTSISADLHKYGYAPKGVSVLLHRNRSSHRLQYFATSRWPGYPVVNSTMLGSKSAGPLAAAWAIIQRLGVSGFAELAVSSQRATARLLTLIEGIDGLRIVGRPVGPLLAVTADESLPPERQVDPHLWADEVKSRGWQLQLQPGLPQTDGVRLPHTTHLTVTPVTERVLDELSGVLVAAADAVRGIGRIDGRAVLEALGGDLDAVLAGPLPDRLAPLMALVEVLPPEVIGQLLIELLSGLVLPTLPDR